MRSLKTKSIKKSDEPAPYKFVGPLTAPALIAECIKFGGMVCPTFQTVGYGYLSRVNGNVMTHASADGNDFQYINFVNGIPQFFSDNSFASSSLYFAYCCMESNS